MTNQCVVGGFTGSTTAKQPLILPDGQLGTPNKLVPTDEPFKPSQPMSCTLLHNGLLVEYQL